MSENSADSEVQSKIPPRTLSAPISPETSSKSPEVSSDETDIDKLVERLLQPENLHTFEGLGISSKAITRAGEISKLIAQIPNTEYLERQLKLKELAKEFINDHSYSSKQDLQTLGSYISTGNQYVCFDNFGQSGGPNIGVESTDEELINNPENTKVAKLHIQVPDKFVPMVGLLTLQAMKVKIMEAVKQGENTFGTSEMKMFTGYRTKEKAEIARIVYYLQNPVDIPFYEAVSLVFAPILKIMDINGLKAEAASEDDVTPPSFNTPVKNKEVEVPNLYTSFGHSHLRREMNKRGIIGLAFDEKKNYAIPLNLDLSLLKFFI